MARESLNFSDIVQYDADVNPSEQNDKHIPDNGKQIYNDFIHNAPASSSNRETPCNNLCSEIGIKIPIDQEQYDHNVNPSFQSDFHTTNNWRTYHNESLTHALEPRLHPEIVCDNLHNWCFNCDECEMKCHNCTCCKYK